MKSIYIENRYTSCFYHSQKFKPFDSMSDDELSKLYRYLKRHQDTKQNINRFMGLISYLSKNDKLYIIK